ncbi:hypothetical protein [Maribacter aestuarii]|uniref:hypothetical protein n=1 Tax=Maribacter aestuarii TaxID=1130723 RepID=UPI0025A55625|nr:hypothetical protein [Maribacter aestuarii]
MENTRARVQIILQVNAADLFAISYPTEAEIKKFCEIEDDFGGSVSEGGKPITDFKTKVKKIKGLPGSGESNDTGYDISIDSIVMVNRPANINFFKRSTLLGNGGRYGEVSGRVKNKGLEDGDEYTYNINFTITQDETENSKSYSLDPKLQYRMR